MQFLDAISAFDGFSRGGHFVACHVGKDRGSPKLSSPGRSKHPSVRIYDILFGFWNQASQASHQLLRYDVSTKREAKFLLKGFKVIAQLAFFAILVL